MIRIRLAVDARLFRGGKLDNSRRRNWRGRSHGKYIPNQANAFEDFNDGIRHIEFPPAVAAAGRARIGMVVVVPAFAKGNEGDPPDIAAVILGFEVAVAPNMSDRIHKPGAVPHPDDSGET